MMVPFKTFVCQTKRLEGDDQLENRYIQSYFQLLESQRNYFYQYIEENGGDRWKRPIPDKWSAGETVYHLIMMVRLVRRFSAFYIPLMLPYAKMRKRYSYRTETYNIYKEYTEKKKRPMKASFVLTPPKNLHQKYNFKELQQILHAETIKLKEKITHLDEHIAGQIIYPDPVAYYPNVIQSIHLLAIHEQHHFDLVKKYEHKI